MITMPRPTRQVVPRPTYEAVPRQTLTEAEIDASSCWSSPAGRFCPSPAGILRPIALASGSGLPGRAQRGVAERAAGSVAVGGPVVCVVPVRTGPRMVALLIQGVVVADVVPHGGVSSWSTEAKPVVRWHRQPSTSSWPLACGGLGWDA